jgi:hypothetical protein
MNNVLASVLDFLRIIIQVAMAVPKNKLLGNWIMQSIKLLSIKYFLIFCSAPLRYKTPGNSTIAAVPLVANQDKQCITKAKSAFDLGAKTPAGENLSSLISNGLASPSHLIEYGGFETIASNGSSLL